MIRKSLLILMTLLLSASFTMAQNPEPTGKGLKIWFDTGGPVGGSYNTIVYNGAKAAANDIGATMTYLYSDWQSEKMIANFKKALASKPDGIVVMGHPGDAAYKPFIDEARSKGIIVTSVDTPLPESLASYQAQGFGYIGPDNYIQGRMMASERLFRNHS